MLSLLVAEDLDQLLLQVTQGAPDQVARRPLRDLRLFISRETEAMQNRKESAKRQRYISEAQSSLEKASP
jgi:hypothetical protein